ncbi:MAG TPA: hypothetical protein VGO61_14900 [Steroidobacteraceae bacterium]|jgi:hypothetical protein|nr:hypothetical protein [Steroidobacteraceae bacterium]
MRITRLSGLIAAGAATLLIGCAKPPEGVGFDTESGRFSVHANGVTRGELLDQLAKVAQVEVRPQPPRDERLTISADDLDVDELLARIMPADMRYIARRGAREIASKAPAADARKDGAAEAVSPELTAKGKGGATAREGAQKAAAESKLGEAPARAAGPMFKAEARTMVASEKNEPKKPLPTRIPRATLRVTLLFELGKAPKVLSAQNIEGGPPVERFVRGPFLFLLTGADGGIVQFGSFEDPLEEHSYLQEGRHSVGRAQSGIAGISLDNSKLSAANLQIIDAREVALPRELTEEAVRSIMQRAKPIATIKAAQLLRASQQESAQ